MCHFIQYKLFFPLIFSTSKQLYFSLHLLYSYFLSFHFLFLSKQSISIKVCAGFAASFNILMHKAQKYQQGFYPSVLLLLHHFAPLLSSNSLWFPSKLNQ